MKNLQNFGVQELNSNEMRQIDGGIIPIIVFGIVIGWKAIAGAVAVGIFAAGVYVGYKQAAK